MLGYYHTILAIVIRFSGTGIRCWVTTIRYSATGIRFSFHRIPVAHGEQEVEGAERARRVAYSHTMLARKCREIRA